MYCLASVSALSSSSTKFTNKTDVSILGYVKLLTKSYIEYTNHLWHTHMYLYGYFMVCYFIARIDKKLIHIILLSSIDGCYFKQHLQYGGPIGYLQKYPNSVIRKFPSNRYFWSHIALNIDTYSEWPPTSLHSPSTFHLIY